MVIDVVVRDVDEVKLLCSWCKVVIMYEVVVSYVKLKKKKKRKEKKRKEKNRKKNCSSVVSLHLLIRKRGKGKGGEKRGNFWKNLGWEDEEEEDGGG